MRAYAEEAGPEISRERRCTPAEQEAAGPAGPRLIYEGIGIELRAGRQEVIVTLARGSGRYKGSAAGPLDRPRLELTAAATVAAIQQYLQTNASDPATPQVKLQSIAVGNRFTNRSYVLAHIELTHEGRQSDLLGSAFVRNDSSSAAVAAVLDAVTRPLSLFGEIGAEPLAASKRFIPSKEKEPLVERARNGPNADAEESAGESEGGEAGGDDVVIDESSRMGPRGGVGVWMEERGYPAAGLAITSSGIRGAAIDIEGRVISEARRTLQEGIEPENRLAAAIDVVRELMVKMNGRAGLACIGVAVPGRLNGEVALDEAAGLHDWGELEEPLSREFSAPARSLGPVYAAVYGEYRFGAAQGIEEALYLRVGAEIEAAFLSEGRFIASPHEKAGQVGHMVIEADGPRCGCGELGCWQALAGREAMIARAVKAVRNGAPTALAGSVSALTPGLIVRLAGAGDEAARAVIEETGRYCAIGLANLIALYGSKVAIIETQPAVVGRALLPSVERWLKASRRANLLAQCVLVSPKLGEAGVAIGAAAWAARNAD